LIKEIGQRLGQESYSLIDITFQQFGVRTADEWNGTSEDYVLRMVRDAKDQTLVDLGQHVGYRFEQTETPGIEPAFWRPGMLRLFLSHLAIYKKFAGELQDTLLPYGISAFVAHNDIEPTLEWQVQIETALATCEVLVALLHGKFHESNWTDQEIGFAMGCRVPTFAVRLGETPYGFIGRFQAFNGNGKTPSDLAREIFDAFRKNKQTQRKMSEAMIGLFEDSYSYAEADKRMGLVESLDAWDASFAARLRAAVQANNQISGSFKVPRRVEALIKKWEQATIQPAR
jgi:hypothetical protein